MNLANSDDEDGWNISTIAGYPGKTLTKKLGIVDESRFLVVNQPENYFKLLPDLPFETVVLLEKDAQGVDLIHYFSKDFSQLKQDLPKLKEQIYKNGAIWVSWPEKTTKEEVDIDENKIKDFALNIGLMGVKVCKIDQIWSGLKLVIPVKDQEFKKLMEVI